jgi:hypothetical protein
MNRVRAEIAAPYSKNCDGAVERMAGCQASEKEGTVPNLAAVDQITLE